MNQVTKSELNDIAVGAKAALTLIQSSIKSDDYAAALENWKYLQHMTTGLKLGIDARRVQKGA